jgi:hypothetical protein
MTISEAVATRSLRADATLIVAGWAAVATATAFVATYGTPASDGPWGTKTLIVAAAAGLVVALMRIGRDRSGRAGAKKRTVSHTAGLVLGGVVWLLGGLADALLYFLLLLDPCEGAGKAASVECLHRAGPILDLLGLTLAAAPTAALIVLIYLRRYSRVVALLSPALMVGLYLLAAWIWMPHAGLGVPDRTTGW